MKKIKSIGLVLFILSSIGYTYGQSNNYGLKEKTISTTELSTWNLLGKGAVGTWGDQTSLQEADDTKGIMLVSLEAYSNDVIVRYKVLALTPATVFVTLLAVSDEGDSDKLTVPDNYDGSIGLWTKEKENYFFAFKNAPHNVTPFVKKHPNAAKALVAAAENSMIAGVYYDIEVGKYKGKLWLAIDGEKVFEIDDKKPLAGGHIAVRLRGTAGFKAGCLIKDMIILSKD